MQCEQLARQDGTISKFQKHFHGQPATKISQKRIKFMARMLKPKKLSNGWHLIQDNGQEHCNINASRGQ